MGRRPRVFFAIPCGHFYDTQASVIKEVCDAAGIDPLIVEDDPGTKGLWEKIVQQIHESDRFVADISSGSPNIALELGFAIKEKGERHVAIFNSNATADPSDLRGLVLQKYSSLRDFRQKLVAWLADSLPSIDPESIPNEEPTLHTFTEEFRDHERFLRLWTIPPGGSYRLTADGLQISDTHFPITTEHLGLIENCEFEFLARIDQKQIGWIIRGTRHPRVPVPAFAVMFVLNSESVLRPHLLSLVAEPGPVNGYHVYDEQSVEIDTDEQGWFTLTTRVEGDTVTIQNGSNRIFEADLSREPYGEVYNSTSPKQGQVGFRCFPGEIATVARVTVRELLSENSG